MLHVTPAGALATLAIILGLLLLDWFVLGRRPHEIALAEAARWSVFYVAVSALFGVGFALINGWGLGAQFFAGYLVEKSLSVDNLFVFVIIIGSFSVPAAQQPKVLTIGITLALILRAVFIALGAALLELFSFMFLIFGLGLIITSIQLFRHRDRDPDVGENLVVRAARRALPLSERYDGNRLITTRDGRRLMTPMLLALIAIGTTDVLFAFDSIPAIFGISRHPYVVLVVNAFALLGLRPLYFLVSGLLDRLLYISTGLAAILAFIGVKLVLAFAHDRSHGVPEISTEISLAVIAIVLGLTTAASLLTARRDPEARAHAGALRARSADERAQPDEPSVR